MLLTVMQALGELAVLYPVNGVFYQHFVRFIDPAWYGGIFWMTEPYRFWRRDIINSLAGDLPPAGNMRSVG